ncbi:hypothetical protein EUX98_g8739 [Antrodiella citrinella]|uniref:Uncharacterized protein n=1 Tax=Antrodiella citrinella TaxID=2447956 RepID=A0A4S4M3E2_9APHY|nr:hypothetical protein EUX98_g8739 [Antrodiella citrinella]
MAPSPTVEVFAQSSSEFAALHGHRAMTPIIAGAISGGAVGLAWLVGFVMYFYKRHRRERRAIAAGYRGHREMLDPPKKPEAFIIPPDPAIVEGKLQPGDNATWGPSPTDSLTERGLIASSGNTTPTDSSQLQQSMSEPVRFMTRRSRTPPIHSTTAIPHRSNTIGYPEVT